jgi:hypothetical protein
MRFAEPPSPKPSPLAGTGVYSDILQVR